MKKKKKKYKLKELDVGTIVDVYAGGEAYEIEFIDKKGKMIELVTLCRGKEENEKRKE